MKKFKFRFEAIEKVRRLEMEQQAKALALVHQKIQAVKDEIQSFIQLSNEEVLRVQKLAMQGNFSEQVMHLSLAYREGLKRKGIEKKRELENLEKKAEEEKILLIEKTRRKKVFEKLEEKEKAEYEIESKRTQTKEMDEIAGILRDRDLK